MASGCECKGGAWGTEYPGFESHQGSLMIPTQPSPRLQSIVSSVNSMFSYSVLKCTEFLFILIISLNLVFKICIIYIAR